jgi:hypothetical protein
MSTAKGADSWETGYFAAGTAVWQRKEAGHYSGLITRTGRHPNTSTECGQQTKTLQHTPNTTFHLNNGDILAQSWFLACHHFWLHAEKRIKWKV